MPKISLDDLDRENRAPTKPKKKIVKLKTEEPKDKKRDSWIGINKKQRW
jgi:hypothetical protein